MVSPTITYYKDGTLHTGQVFAPAAPRRAHKWRRAYASTLWRAGVRCGVVRFSGAWRFFDVVDEAEFGRTFPTQEAAEMWLLHRKGRP